ncbi:MAG: hypothetical protein AB7I33_14485 [Gemmatimonadales bacterium]
MNFWEILIVLAVLVSVGAVALFLQRRRHQSRLRPDIGLADVRGCVVTLLEQGYDLGFVAFILPGEDRFVEFSKYIREERETGIQLDFPKASWAGPYYEQVKSLLEARGIAYHVEDTPDGPVREFIQADLGRDVDLAAELAREIFVRVFKTAPEVRISAEFEHVNPATRGARN